MTIRAVVIGAGWAGEGHIVALREAGVEVVALFGRTPEPAYQRAVQLGVTDVRFDWRAGLTELRPEIVSIATPAGLHRAITEFAAVSHAACGRSGRLLTKCFSRRGVSASNLRSCSHCVNRKFFRRESGEQFRQQLPVHVR